MCDNCCTPFIGGEGCSSALQKRASNIASGDYSIATGHGTIASNEGELATGTYNKANQGQIFSVGVGTSDSNRMNALQVNTDGSTSFLHNGRLVKLSDLIETINHDGVALQMQVIDGYLKYSIDNGITWTNIIEMSELKGESGDNLEQVSAEIIQTEGGSPGVSTSFNNGVLHFVFSNLGGSGGTTPAALEHATDNALGGIKTGYSESGSNYAVKLDSNDRAYVTVPNNGGTTPSSQLQPATTSSLGGVIVGSGLDVTNNGTLSVKAAGSSEVGGIKTGYQTQAQNGNYAVLLNTNNEAYVHVSGNGGTNPGGTGTDGGFYDFAFKAVASGANPGAPLDDYPLNETTGWHHYAENNDGSKDVYMTVRFVTGDLVPNAWYTPWVISGQNGLPGTPGADGENGVDGDKYEYIYARTTDESVNPPAVTYTSNNNKTKDDDDFVPVNWYDSAHFAQVQMTSTYRVVWFCMRVKENGVWSNFIGPFPWSVWGKNGLDGDGVEYIFYSDTTHPISEPQTWTSDPDFQNREYIRNGTGWVDDPVDLSGVSYGPGYKQWVSIRRKYSHTAAEIANAQPGDEAYGATADVAFWHAYTAPALWGYYPDTTGTYVDFDNEVMAVPIQSNGMNYAYNNYTKVYMFSGAVVRSATISSVVVEDSTTPTPVDYTSQNWVTCVADTTNGGYTVTVNIPINSINLQGKVLNVRVTMTDTIDNITINKSATLQLMGIEFGGDGESYDLVLGTASIRRNVLDQNSPTNIYPLVKKIKGTDLMTAPFSPLTIQTENSGFDILYEIDNSGSEVYMTPHGGNAGMEYISTASITNCIRFELDYNNVLVDQETIWVNRDGSDGTPGTPGDDGIDGENAIYLDLTNENDTMLYSGNTLISGSATSQAILYNGGVPVDTTQFMNPNIFSKVSSTGCTATVNSSTGVVEVTAMSAVTGEVVVGASYMGNTYTAVMTLKRQDSGEKYILVVAPNNITYNEDEDDLSHNSVDVSVNIGHLNANGAYIEESASSVYPSGYFPVGNDTSGQLMLRVNDNNVSITTGTGVNRITSYPISHTISVDPANDNGYDIRIVRRTRPGGIGTSYVYETLDVETVNIGRVYNGEDGAGTSAIIADLTNECDGLAVGNDGVLDVSSPVVLTTTVQMYEGTTSLSINGISCSVPSGFQSHITAQGTTNTGVVTISIADGADFSAVSSVPITISATSTTNVTRQRIFTIIPVREGEDGAVFKLVPSADIITSTSYNGSYSYSPSSVSCERMLRRGMTDYSSSSYGYLYYSVDNGTSKNLYSTSISVSDIVAGGYKKVIFYWYSGLISALDSVIIDRETVPIIYDGTDGTPGVPGIDGKDALPIRIRRFSDLKGESQISFDSQSNPIYDDCIFSGYESIAKFRDVLVITEADYANIGYAFPFNEMYNGVSRAVPVLMVVNYDPTNHPNGYNGDDVDLQWPHDNINANNPTNYTTIYPGTAAASQQAASNGYLWSVFMNMGSVYFQLLAANEAFISALTAQYISTNTGNNSFVEIQNGFIKFHDANGKTRIILGQGTGDTTPVLKFYDDTGTAASGSTPETLGTELYNLGPGGILKANGSINLPEWTRYSAVMKNTTTGGNFDGNEVIDPTTAVYIYKYDAGYRYAETTPGSNQYVKLYLDPFSMSTFGVEPDINGDYFDNSYSHLDSSTYTSHLKPLGQYILMPIEPDRTYGYSADVIRIVSGQGGVRNVITGWKARFTENNGVYTMDGAIFDPNAVPTP